LLEVNQRSATDAPHHHLVGQPATKREQPTSAIGRARWPFAGIPAHQRPQPRGQNQRELATICASADLLEGNIAVMGNKSKLNCSLLGCR
jgi:hypothetical protein